MHAVGLAASVLETANQIAVKCGADVCVLGVKVRIGELTGVAAEALQFAFESLRGGTPCEEAQLEVERVPLVGRCIECGWTGPLADQWNLWCARCSRPLEMVSGRE